MPEAKLTIIHPIGSLRRITNHGPGVLYIAKKASLEDAVPLEVGATYEFSGNLAAWSTDGARYSVAEYIQE